jgi:hypothetical protein
MPRRVFPVVPSGQKIYLTSRPLSRRGEIVERVSPLEVRRQTAKSVTFGGESSEFCVPKSALVSTNHPDILALQGWYRVPSRARDLVA